MPVFSQFSPAKINLHLSVKDRRQDGFHNLESIFAALDFGDILYFELTQDEYTDEIIMEGLDFELPIKNNIIYKALTIFRERTGFSKGVKIRVEKHIPPGGGLGGGSSNAAATLLALNKLAGGSGLLSRDALLEAAATLGSDVPFFIHETAAAWVTGRGEIVKPVDIPDWNFVLVNPGFASDTGAAFRLLDEYRKKEKRKMKKEESREQRAVTPTEREQRTSCPLSPVPFFNDFLPVFNEPEKSVYNKIITNLQELGAEYASLSGAGSTCFGFFLQKEQADIAVKILQGEWKFVKIARCLIDHHTNIITKF